MPRKVRRRNETGENSRPINGEDSTPAHTKAEWTKGEANPRFVVTSLKRTETGARELYEDI
jgi:hypothetical protein